MQFAGQPRDDAGTPTFVRLPPSNDSADIPVQAYQLRIHGKNGPRLSRLNSPLYLGYEGGKVGFSDSFGSRGLICHGVCRQLPPSELSLIPSSDGHFSLHYFITTFASAFDSTRISIMMMR